MRIRPGIHQDDGFPQGAHDHCGQRLHHWNVGRDLRHLGRRRHKREAQGDRRQKNGADHGKCLACIVGLPMNCYIITCQSKL